jgi:hypothetical protein
MIAGFRGEGEDEKDTIHPAAIPSPHSTTAESKEEEEQQVRRKLATTTAAAAAPYSHW